METRVCRTCGSRKSIRGIWYLIPSPDRPATVEGPTGPGGSSAGESAGPEFLCESCFEDRSDAGASASFDARTDVASYWRQPDRSA